MTNEELIEKLKALPPQQVAFVRVNDGARPDHPWFGHDLVVDGVGQEDRATIISVTVGGVAFG